MVLVLNIVSNLVLVGTNRGYKVSSAPELAFGEFFRLLLYPCGCLFFHNLYGICCRVFWWNINVQMNMFIANVPLANGKPFPLCYLLEPSFHLLFNIRVTQYFSSVFGNKYEMVTTLPCAVLKTL